LEGLAMAIRFILWSFGAFFVIWYIFPVLVCCTKKNLAYADKDEAVPPFYETFEIPASHLMEIIKAP
jgi:hypothetical protein